MERTLNLIFKEKIIAIIRGIERDAILDMARAIKKGGISCLEIALDHSTAGSVRNAVSYTHLDVYKRQIVMCITAYQPADEGGTEM